MGATPNTFAGRNAVLPFFSLAQTERTAVVGIGNSNQLHAGDGWDHGFQAAFADRCGLFGAGPYSCNDNGGNGSGAGYYFGAWGGGAYTGAPSQLEAYLNRGSGALFPACYTYWDDNGDIVNNQQGGAVIYTNDSTSSSLVPVLSGYTGGGVTVSASHENGADIAWKAFDGGYNGGSQGKWSSTTKPCWLKVVSPSTQVTAYAITGWDFAGGAPQAWQLQGSNDGTNWSTLDTQTLQVFSPGQTTSYTVPLNNRANYTQHRLYITESYQETYVVVGELNLTGTVGSYPNSPFNSKKGFTTELTHGTFTTGSGKLTMTLDPYGANGSTAMAAGTAGNVYGIRSPTVNVSTGTYGITTTSLTLPANETRVGYDTWMARVASAAAITAGTGTVNTPHFGLWWQFSQPGTTAGIAYSTLDYRGGQPIRAIATDLQQASDLTLTTYFSRVRAPLGPNKAVLVIINEAQNHRNDDAGTSVGPNPTVGDSAAGFVDNAQAIVNRVKAIYSLNGWDTSRLYFLFIGDHALSDPDDAQVVSYRQALVTSIVAGNANTASVDLSQLLNGTEMAACNYYDAGGADHAHLVTGGAGYKAIALKVIDGLSSVGESTSSGSGFAIGNNLQFGGSI